MELTLGNPRTALVATVHKYDLAELVFVVAFNLEAIVTLLVGVGFGGVGGVVSGAVLALETDLGAVQELAQLCRELEMASVTVDLASNVELAAALIGGGNSKEGQETDC